jgi:hypothetical protein
VFGVQRFVPGIPVECFPACVEIGFEAVPKDNNGPIDWESELHGESHEVGLAECAESLRVRSLLLRWHCEGE